MVNTFLLCLYAVHGHPPCNAGVWELSLHMQYGMVIAYAVWYGILVWSVIVYTERDWKHNLNVLCMFCGECGWEIFQIQCLLILSVKLWVTWPGVSTGQGRAEKEYISGIATLRKRLFVRQRTKLGAITLK